MRKLIGVLMVLGVIVGASTLLTGCGDEPRQSSDRVQQTQQEKLLQEGTAQVGMPAIKNFRERKLVREAAELRDQEGLRTYTYLENLQPQIVHGRTALGGKFTYLGESIGYPVPYATQFTNPMKKENNGYQETPLPQADPNGLFPPSSAEGTWILMYDPVQKKALPQYMEPRVACFTYKLPED